MDIIIPILIILLQTFLASVATTFILFHLVKKFNIVRKNEKNKTSYGEEAKVFKELKSVKEKQIPRMGGAAITLAIILVIFPFFIDHPTFITSFVYLLFIGAALFGIFDDILEFIPPKYSTLSLYTRVAVAGIFGALAGIILHILGVATITIFTVVPIGIAVIFFSVIWYIAWFSTGVIDGVDGLSAGLYMIMFLFLTLFFMHHHIIDFAIISAITFVAIIPFWFLNLPPAKIYLTESGTFPLSLLLGTLALFGSTQGVYVIPFLIILALPLITAPASNIVQLVYRKIYKRKLLKIAPIHHHFEAMGFSATQIILSYYLFAALTGLIALIIFL